MPKWQHKVNKIHTFCVALVSRKLDDKHPTVKSADICRLSVMGLMLRVCSELDRWGANETVWLTGGAGQIDRRWGYLTCWL